MEKRRKRGKSSSHLSRFGVWDVVIYALLAIFALITLYPFIYTVAGSFNDALDLMYGPVWFYPREFTTASYATILKDPKMFRSFFNTLLVTVVTVPLALLVTSCTAYALSRSRLKCRKLFWTVNLIPLFITGGMIPGYMVILLTGLYDSFLVYIVPALYSSYNAIILVSFFKSIDGSMYDAAVVDGASEFRILFTIYMPLSTPALATIGLWIAVGRWNSYMPTMLYTNKNENMWLLQYYLMTLIRQGEMPDIESQYFGHVNAQTLSFAAIVISSLPILLVYPFLTRFYSKGLALGSLKG